jgi:predicted HicB family RNase H-like nuclease
MSQALKIGKAFTSHWPAFNLRMPTELKLRLAAEAKTNGRSLNAEIVQRLLRSLESYSR